MAASTARRAARWAGRAPRGWLTADFANALGVSAEGIAKGAGETVNEIGNALMNMLQK
jgi:hypothetical protein